jgi:hypothetical protein
MVNSVDKVSPKSRVKTILIACNNRRTAAESRPYLAQQAGTDSNVRATICASQENCPLSTPHFFPTGPACREIVPVHSAAVHVIRTRGCVCEGEIVYVYEYGYDYALPSKLPTAN